MQKHFARTTSFVHQGFLHSIDAVKIGRIVLDPCNPIETYCDVFPNQDNLTSEIHIDDGIDLACTYNSSKQTSFGCALLQLFRGYLSRSNEQEICVEGETKRYQLSNAESNFKIACAQNEIREWLQENVIKPKVDAYMIVGYHTITNAKITNGRGLARGVDVQADDGNIGNMIALGLSRVTRMKSSAWNTTTDQRQMVATGERLWAVQYRKVVYKLEGFLSEKKTNLKSSQWKIMWKVRGQEGSGEYLVEVDLGDTPDEADFLDDDEDEEAIEPTRYVNKVLETGVEEEFIFFHDTKLNFILDQENNDSSSMNASQNKSIGGESMEISSSSEGENDYEMGELWDTRTPIAEAVQTTTSLDRPAGTRNSSGSGSPTISSGAGQKRARSSRCDSKRCDVDGFSIVGRDLKRLKGPERRQQQ
ncbi:hypothetical protein EV426DRAFT_613091 [Tirmania nivea]|nr:hypothetical protein EV426DRAFT_613091 [Tirmania nivea]